MSFSSIQKRLLIELAREKILQVLMPEYKRGKQERIIPEALWVKCGAFVSLYVDNKLRGCIGTFSEEEPLYATIKRMAHSAATSDSRFLPIKAEEVVKLKIELSILSPRLLVTGIEKIEIGKHGIYMELGTNRGTLLPQVAVDQGWTTEEFLGNCSRYKAGLDWDGWKSARLFTYEATVFDSDSEIGIVNKS
jgi:AmmeMemoRadiSam system protein A